MFFVCVCVCVLSRQDFNSPAAYEYMDRACTLVLHIKIVSRWYLWCSFSRSNHFNTCDFCRLLYWLFLAVIEDCKFVTRSDVFVLRKPELPNLWKTKCDWFTGSRISPKPVAPSLHKQRTQNLGGVSVNPDHCFCMRRSKFKPDVLWFARFLWIYPVTGSNFLSIVGNLFVLRAIVQTELVRIFFRFEVCHARNTVGVSDRH